MLGMLYKTVLKGENNIADLPFIQVAIVLNVKPPNSWNGKILESVYCLILLLDKMIPS